MTRRRHVSHRLLIALALVFAVFVLPSAKAAEPSVAAKLSHSQLQLGQAARLEIQISDASEQIPPPELSVEGLTIRYLGPSKNSVMSFGRGVLTSSSTLTHVYHVTPQRAGMFTIPSVTIRSDGKVLQTEALTLHVGAAPPAAGGSGNADAASPAQPAFAEITLPKESAYVGETLLLELRLYVDGRLRSEPEQLPQISGEGFTKQKLARPRQELARRDGRDYRVYVFRTAITPSRAGKLEIGPGEIEFAAQVPRQRDRRSQFGGLLDDFFNDPFFAPMQRMTASAAAVALEVKPLPMEGRPLGFTGAVGQFKLAAKGTPTEVKVGDPVTMTIEVSGRGNFDRVEMPTVVDGAGWQSYQPAVQFKATDETGTTGAKSFELAVVPQERKRTMPQFEFAYFDPAKERYETIRTAPADLQVIGAPPPAPPPPSAASAPATSSAAAAAPPASASATDILGILPDRGAASGSFEPLHLRQEFWWAQVAPLSLLLGWGAWRLRRRDERSRTIAHLRREKVQARNAARTAHSAAEYLEQAVRFVQLHTALRTGRAPETVDLSAARTSLHEPDMIKDVEELFTARAELLYAGTAPRDEHLSEAQRSRFDRVLEQLDRNHGHH